MMNEIESFFNNRNSAFEVIEDGVIRSAFHTKLLSGEEHDFGFLVLLLENSFGDGYIRFTIVPLVPQPKNGFSINIYKFVGQANHELLGIKLGFDPDGDIELAHDLRIESLNNKNFDDIIQNLADHAISLYAAITSILADEEENVLDTKDSKP